MSIVFYLFFGGLLLAGAANVVSGALAILHALLVLLGSALRELGR